MRKRLFYSLFLGAALCMTTACSDDDNNGNEGPGGGNGNGNVPVTTVEQAQEEIDRVGKALAAKIDVERLKPTISLLEYCENTFFNEDDEVMLPDNPNRPDYASCAPCALAHKETLPHWPPSELSAMCTKSASSTENGNGTKLRKSGIKLPMHR